jgi:hypothetical protein
MFVCLECGCTFEDPKHCVNKHGLDTPPYEEYSVCPECGGDYTEAFRCDCCDEWITDTYIKIGSERYCDDCYHIMKLGEEY